MFWPVLLGYVRIVTHPRLSRRPLSVATATAVIDELLDSPSINVVGEAPTFWAGYRSLDIGRPIAGNDVPDAAIVALMLTHGVSTIYTRDRGFRRFDGIRIVDPFA